jgi:DME family drug/metabolite transporter
VRPSLPAARSNMTARRARVMILIAAVMFGTTGTAQELGPDDIPPAAVGAARVVLGGALLVAWSLRRPRRFESGRWRTSSPISAALSIAAYQPLFFLAVERVGVALGTVIAIGTGPFFAGALSWSGAERPRAGWVMASAIAVAGVALLLLSDAEVAGDAGGVACALAAGMAYARYTVAFKGMLVRGASPAGATGAVFAVAALFALPLLLAAGADWLLTPRGLALGAFLAIVPTALGYILYLRGLDRLSAPTVTTPVLAEPVTAALLASPYWAND